MAIEAIDKIPGNIYSLALVLYLTKEHTDPRNVRLQLGSSIGDKKHADLLILPPEAYDQDSPYRSVLCSSPATLLRDGHMVAGDRLPMHSMDALAALLNHLTLDSPEYSFQFSSADLAKAVQVTRRRDGTPIDVTVPELDPTWIKKVTEDWEQLIKTQRYILGGATTLKMKLPSREPKPIKLTHLPLYPDKLSKLGSARERLYSPDRDGPVASTSRVAEIPGMLSLT
ncbi:hypothetical protein NEOLEDRAFT_1184939 [Neolentinus lepideus HHB14362 ss-1]|uniref:Uncharacterized protein n=1 Tax=Neolentinus lepideus HHB14362 ss-1 TaxID=1314782 RepID=A0A165ISU4_9AGAM|nr:hypothetical protein NEOLEDRAFT_1184939 [Neolentinus lepideus HHB14362 ss-1]